MFFLVNGHNKSRLTNVGSLIISLLIMSVGLDQVSSHVVQTLPVHLFPKLEDVESEESVFEVIVAVGIPEVGRDLSDAESLGVGRE